MRVTTSMRLAGQHAATVRASIGLVVAVMLVGAIPMLVGLNAAGLITRAVESQTDEVDIRKIAIEPRVLHDSRVFDASSPLSGSNIKWWSPLIEIGARVRASDTEIEDVNHEGTSTPGSFVTIEGFSRGDPRFVSDRVRAQVPIPEALFTSSKPVAIITRGLAHELRSAGSLTISVNRTVGGESETLTLDIAVLGVTHSDTRRLFMGSRVVQALDNWSAGGTFEPDISEPSSLRALLFAERARDVETVVASLEAAGWRVQHRLRDVQSLQRTRRLIYAVSALACSGYLLAGFIAAAVYVASTRRQARVNAAVLKLCGVTPVASGIILIVPLMLAAIMGFVVSVIVASFAASRLSGLVGPLLGVELSLQASGMGFGVILLVATTTMLPLVSGLAWSFLNCWRAPIRDSLCSPGQC